MNILIFFVVLLVLVLAHEFGHFIAAKKAGMKVEEFGFGFPPRLFKWRKGETLYSLNALPLGGFVKIFGEDPANTETKSSEEDKKAFYNKPKSTQALVLAAGVFFNLLLAWILLSVSLMAGLPYDAERSLGAKYVRDPAVVIIEIIPGSPAEGAGLEMGDRLPDFGSVKEARDFAAANKGRETIIAYQRGEEKFTASLTPPLGVSLGFLGSAHLPPPLAVLEGARFVGLKTWEVTRLVGELIGGIFTGASSLQMLTGPVGIVGVIGEAYQFGLAYLMFFVAFISINLAVLNLLPFPALDGGRLLFLLIERLRGAPLKPKLANSLNLAGFLFLITLMLIITYHDLRSLF